MVSALASPEHRQTKHTRAMWLSKTYKKLPGGFEFVGGVVASLLVCSSWIKKSRFRTLPRVIVPLGRTLNSS